MPPNDYVHITCDNQTSEGSCVSGPGDYCHGHPERKGCNLFFIKNGPGYSSVWASSIRNAREVLDVGIYKRKNMSPLEGIIEIVQINNREFATQIANRNEVKPEDLVN